MAAKLLPNELAEVEAMVVGEPLGAAVVADPLGAAVVAELGAVVAGAAVVGVDVFELLPQAVTAIPVAARSATTARLLVMRKEESPWSVASPFGSRQTGGSDEVTAVCTLRGNLGLDV
jgi:hypothetical protein